VSLVQEDDAEGFPYLRGQPAVRTHAVGIRPELVGKQRRLRSGHGGTLHRRGHQDARNSRSSY
jgi:hypothetical protein